MATQVNIEGDFNPDWLYDSDNDVYYEWDDPRSQEEQEFDKYYFGHYLSQDDFLSTTIYCDPVEKSYCDFELCKGIAPNDNYLSQCKICGKTTHSRCAAEHYYRDHGLDPYYLEKYMPVDHEIFYDEAPYDEEFLELAAKIK